MRFLSTLSLAVVLLAAAGSLQAQPNATTANLGGGSSNNYTTADVLDSLLHDLETNLQASNGAHNPYGFAPGERPQYSAQVIETRLRQLNTVVPMDYNPVIQTYIDMYTTKYPHALSKLAGLGQTYFPIIEEIFEREGIPQEIKYLTVVESAMNPYARSWAGAVGLWQFMYGTGLLYNLKINTYIDERHDPIKATQAAARYLRDLYQMYGDWHLALGAYNCGPGNMNRAIRAAGGSTNFWVVAEYLPKETRGYVPAFIGACYAMSYATEHNIQPTPSGINFLQDSLHVVRQRLDLRELARTTTTDFELLKKLNPELKLAVVPFSEQPYALRVPHTCAVAVQQRRTQNTNPQLGDPHVPAAVTSATGAPAGTRTVYHTLGERERLQDVATQYGVSVDKILEWNNVQAYTMRAGHRLKIYAPLTANGAQNSALQPQRPQAQANPGVSQPYSATAPKYYVVRNGDSLWSIANANATTVDQVVEWNSLAAGGNRITVGQRLRVK
jgi:membrane-bound lytic murein transglycosylase D